MIIELFFDFLFALIGFVLNLFPTGSLPDWAGSDGYLAQVWDMAAGLGAWIPWGLFGTVSAFVLGAVTIGFGIRVVRVIYSMFTGGGGAA